VNLTKSNLGCCRTFDWYWLIDMLCYMLRHRRKNEILNKSQLLYMQLWSQIQFILTNASCHITWLQSCPWVHFMWPNPTQPIDWLTHRHVCVCVCVCVCDVQYGLHALTQLNTTQLKFKNLDPTQPNPTQWNDGVITDADKETKHVLYWWPVID